mmetsp:Transcript_50968/g.118409  ORF Transcript_50968/g.118409 Transcript_50968/m.118409 type:complete len:288 (+) Transcript_50968:167-1030(+)
MPGSSCESSSRRRMAELLVSPASMRGVSASISPSSAPVMRVAISSTLLLTISSFTPWLMSSAGPRSRSVRAMLMVSPGAGPPPPPPCGANIFMGICCCTVCCWNICGFCAICCAIHCCCRRAWTSSRKPMSVVACSSPRSSPTCLYRESDSFTASRDSWYCLANRSASALSSNASASFFRAETSRKSTTASSAERSASSPLECSMWHWAWEQSKQPSNSWFPWANKSLAILMPASAFLVLLSRASLPALERGFSWPTVAPSCTATWRLFADMRYRDAASPSCSPTSL